MEVINSFYKKSVAPITVYVNKENLIKLKNQEKWQKLMKPNTKTIPIIYLSNHNEERLSRIKLYIKLKSTRQKVSQPPRKGGSK